MEATKIILTSLLSVAAIFVITKLMGHKQVAQLDFFDYVSGITIGSIAAELATDIEAPWRSLIALLIYGLVSITLNLLTCKAPRMRRFINGAPTILMNDGVIYRKNLKSAKLDLSEFLLLCREQGYFDLEQIKTAVFEHNGKLSVLPKSAYRPITPTDMQIPARAEHIGVELIMDGRVMGENLTRLGKSAEWLMKTLTLSGYNSPRQILLLIYHPEDESMQIYGNDT